MRTTIALALLFAAAASSGNAAAAWENYDTHEFPNGSAIWSLGDCARAWRDTPYLGCYATPEITITKKEKGKPEAVLKGIIVSKIEENGKDHDAGGYGYCLRDKHPYRIIHEVRVMEKGRAVAYLYPEFYAGAFRPGTAQDLYEWGGALWGTANCDRTDKSLAFAGRDAYTLTSPAAALDFGNIVFFINEQRLTFTKL